MQSKARMTIRFEPPAKPKEPTRRALQPIEVIENVEADKDDQAVEEIFTTWNSPYQDDIHALEEIIRKSETQNEVHSPTVHLTHPAIPVMNERKARIPELTRKVIPNNELADELWSRELSDDEEDQRATGWYNRSALVREETPSWGRVIASVVAAVATGALFGYMVLSLFTGEPLFPGKSGTASQQPSQATSALPNAEKGGTGMPAASVQAPAESAAVTSGETEPSMPASTARLDADVYYMLQYGVFQSKESMEIAVTQLQDKGLAFATEIDDGYRVYVGAARSRDEAELLAAQMPETEIYIKAVGGEALEVSSAVLSQEGVAFMNASADLTRKLAQLSGIGLQDKQPGKLTSVELSDLQEVHQRYLNTISSADKLDNKATEDGKTIVEALNSAILSMAEYNRKPSRYQLWSVQSAAMKALLADRHMRSVLQPE
ncbi:SPOR domain-containing protein [Cohnella herbarum]|uniref:SPOR domain-containing protein n=1 Tax=Cohnella herbarum TaxID=2728023 RepID=A0A7Z2VEN3_9BACL|nr:SPOR domain-containing protein [Cohnella herbarum]QJD81791.1 hypothetical protein HH215_00405 [Cohnella herbarum]